jgi:Ca-activated chloride channel family protein
MPIYDNEGHRIGQRMMFSDLDEGALREIAQQTGGVFFRAADNDTIAAAFKAIDKAQKIEFQAQSYLVTTELFWWLATPGLAVLVLAALLARPPGWTRTSAGQTHPGVAPAHVASNVFGAQKPRQTVP